MSDKVQKIRKDVERIINQRLNLINGDYFDLNEETNGLTNEIIDTIELLQEDPVRGLDNGDMSIERWKQAVAAASNQKNYRSSKGLTETRDDYFVDGVQWADDHPKEEPVSGDLEKTAMQYGTNEFPSLCSGCKHVPIDAFKAGAKWQEAKDKQILNEEGVVVLPEEAFERMKRNLIELAEKSSR